MRVLLCAALGLAIAVPSGCGGSDASGGEVAGGGTRGGASGTASIEPRRAIAGVRLEMSGEEVRGILGRPSAEAPSELHRGWTQLRFDGGRLRVTLDERGKVWDVRTHSREHRTSGGVGVGSSEREVRSAAGPVRCRPYGGPARYRTWRVCVDAQEHLGPFTTFTLIDRRVRHVTVARGLAR